ncbi:MAG TPA: retron St85 family effector protein [Bryocella sp.]|nr:retron St85 family effector protein [Bryocella sp.]
MSELPQKSAELAVKGFTDFLSESTSNIKFRVFLCGKALDEKRKLEDQVADDLRAYLWQRLEQESECQVFLGEHNELIRAYHTKVNYSVPKNINKANLALFEVNLAGYADLIIILPDSPGSYAELGMFSTSQAICIKLLVINKLEYKGKNSFINRGPVIAALGNRAKVLYEDYSDRDRIFEVIQDEVAMIRESIVAERTLSRRRAR